MRNQLKCRVEVTASRYYFYKLFPAFLYSSSSFFLDDPQTILLQDNDTFSKMTDVKMPRKKLEQQKMTDDNLCCVHKKTKQKQM